MQCIFGRRITMAACLLVTWMLIALNPLPGSVAFGQLNHPGMPADASGHVPGTTDPLDEARHKLEKKMEQKRNEDRQKQLVKDTDRLLAMATDLKSEVDKTNKDMLSVDVVKKADEIEKLAKSVKDRMRAQ